MALRLYTSACYQSLNAPLRDKQRTRPHPFPTTIALIDKAIRQLRVENSSAPTEEVTLWRGTSQPPPTLTPDAPNALRSPASQGCCLTRRPCGCSCHAGLVDTEVPHSFLSLGGTERAPMSTTTRLDVAVQYALTNTKLRTGLLMKLPTSSFMERGASLDFLSCFPLEAEVLFPPLTYLRPKASVQTLMVRDVKFIVVEVSPKL